MNKTISDVYEQQGRVLLDTYLKTKRIRLIPIRIDLEARYRDIIIRRNFNALARQYNIKSPNVLEQFMSYYYTWEHKNTAREYCYYDLISNHGLTKANATNLLSKLIKLFEHPEDSNPTKPQITLKSDYYEIKYKDFAIDISAEWYFAKNMTTASSDIYLNSIMYDTYPSIDTSTGFNILFDILKLVIHEYKYLNIYELSLGMHDIILGNKFKNTKHYTYIDCAELSNPISDIKLSQSKTIIFGFKHMYPLDYLKTHVSHDSLLIFATLDTIDAKHQGSYRIQVPFKAINYINKQIDYFASHMSFYFFGPPAILYNIKKYYDEKV
jgi:hypothetical protein